jgi:hypothetical protein
MVRVKAMLNKIVSVKNLGRFRNCLSAGDVTLNQLGD